MKIVFSFVVLLGLASISLAQAPDVNSLDYGDYSSVTLQVKAWDALGNGQHENAVKFTQKCSELYEEQARKMQASLKATPAPDDVNKYWALNDVGTCYFIRGEALMKLGRKDEALAAYKVVVDELYFAQAWDPKGWYWAPADAAYPKVEMLGGKDDIDF